MTPDRLHTVCKIALYLNTNLLNKLKHSILWNIAGNTRPLGCSGEGGQPSLEWRGHLPSRQVSETDHLSCSKWVLTSKANEWPRSLNKHVVMTFSDILSKYFSRFRRPVIATLQSLIFIFEDIFNFFDNICSLNPIPSVTDIKYFSWYLFASVHNIFFSDGAWSRRCSRWSCTSTCPPSWARPPPPTPATSPTPTPASHTSSRAPPSGKTMSLIESWFEGWNLLHHVKIKHL